MDTTHSSWSVPESASEENMSVFYSRPYHKVVCALEGGVRERARERGSEGGSKRERERERKGAGTENGPVRLVQDGMEGK